MIPASLFVIIFCLHLLFPVSVFAVSLEISNLQKINDYYSVEALFTGQSSDSACYIQAVFTKADQTRYFGRSWGQKGDCFLYVSSPEIDYIKQNFPFLQSGIRQTILISPDFDDPDFKGTGDYILKLKRYTGESNSSAGESNTLSLLLESPSIPTETPSPETVATAPPTTASTPTPTPSPTVMVSATPTPSPTRTPTPIPTPATKTPTSSPSPTTTTSQKNVRPTNKSSASPTPEVLSATTSAEIDLLAVSDISSTNTPTPSLTPKQQTQKNKISNRNLITLGILLIAPAAIMFFIKYKDKIS